jgi:hypothetical protein
MMEERTMNCPTTDMRCDAPGTTPCPAERAPAARRRPDRHLLKKLLSQAGEQLFHYRYVRAGLIERALERAEHDREERS